MKEKLIKRIPTLADKNRCTGCSACSLLCPKKCINMHEDNEGFLQPVIDKHKCSLYLAGKCKICELKCPVLNSHATCMDDVGGGTRSLNVMHSRRMMTNVPSLHLAVSFQF